jgi:hypothetical protein
LKGGYRERLRRGIRSKVTSDRGREQPPVFPATFKLVKLRDAGKTGEHPVGLPLCPLHRGPRISPCSAWSLVLTARKADISSGISSGHFMYYRQRSKFTLTVQTPETSLLVVFGASRCTP